MSVTKFALGPFGGELSGLDARAIPPTRAAACQNVVVEPGFIKPGYGFRNIRAVPSGFTAVYGLEHLIGYSSAGVLKEEYVSIETRSGSTHPYSIDPVTGVSAEIKNGVASVSPAASDWRAFAFDDKSYWYNPSASKIVRHLIGDNTSWVELTQPSIPTAANVYVGAEQNFAGWTGAGSGTWTIVNATVQTNSYVEAQHTASTTGTASFKIDLNGSTAGIQDLSFQDVIYFEFTQPTAGFRIDPATLTIVFINNDGAPITHTPTSTVVQEYDAVSGNGRVWLYFDGKTRADFDNERWVVFTYKILSSTGTATNNIIRFLNPVYRRIDLAFGWTTTPDNLTFGYTNYNSGADIESDMKTATYTRAAFDSARTTSTLGDSGKQPYIKTVASADPNVDKVRLYYLAPDDQWHRIGEQAKATTTFNIQLSNVEALALPVFQPATFKTDNVLCAGTYKGSCVVWGYRGRFENIRWSRIGEPEKGRSGVEMDGDNDRGANFSLRQDDPVAFVEADDAFIILGYQGVYAQVPIPGQSPTPTTMTPPKRLPASKGCAGPFSACRWRDDNGFAGVAFLEPAGEVYMALVSDQFDGDSGFRLVELSAPIRGTIDAFLRVGQGLADFSTARLSVDEATDSLWVVMGARAVVLQRPNVQDGERPWVRRLWATGGGTVKYLAFSPQRRMRWIRSTGEFDENEWNSSTGAWIEGANRHGGNAMPADSAYYTGPIVTMQGDNTRAFKVYVQRDTLTDQTKVVVASTRQSQTYTIPSGQLDVRLSQLQQGREHQVGVILQESHGPIRSIVTDLWGRIQKQKVDLA